MADDADSDSDRIRRAAEELLQRGRDGTGMTETVARYRQFELAQLLHAVARAVEASHPLPSDLLRHAANLSRHILSYPPASLAQSVAIDESLPKPENPPTPTGS